MCNHDQKNCEIQVDGQEMAVMVGKWKKIIMTIQYCILQVSLGFGNKFTWIVIISHLPTITAITWQPTRISNIL